MCQVCLSAKAKVVKCPRPADPAESGACARQRDQLFVDRDASMDYGNVSLRVDEVAYVNDQLIGQVVHDVFCTCKTQTGLVGLQGHLKPPLKTDLAPLHMKCLPAEERTKIAVK